jgi:hypothetical protein
MIPAGVEPINAEGVARIRGTSLGSLRNSGVLNDPSFPRPLNAHRHRDLVWDPAEVQAHARGDELLPRPAPSPDDLLDDAEAAAVVGVAVDTFVQQVDRLAISPRSIAAHGLRYWRRGDLVRRHEQAPGRSGKPAGAKDLAPRRRRGAPAPIAGKAAARIGELAAYLESLAAEGKPRPDTAELAKRYGVSQRTINRWLVSIDGTS